LEVPFWLGLLLSRQQQFSLPEGSFRGCALLSSNGCV